MSLPWHFDFRTTELPASAVERQVVASKVYEVFANGIAIGYTTYTKDKQWVCWNTHGEFWTSYGTSRAKAAEGLVDASWRHFMRPKAA